ncbi:MAG: hypothetical protein ABSG69_17730, partial [Candidatus Acidiferrum sp.]
MKIRPRISVGVVLWLAVANVCCLLTAAQVVSAQNSTGATKTDSTKTSAPASAPVNTRIKITVTGGDNNTAVENASVYVKYVEEHTISKDKKLELNVKTSRDGVAHVPNAPSGRVLIQVI